MKAIAGIWNFQKRRASASRSSSRRTAAWFRSSSRTARGRTSARARRCRGGRRSCRWRTRKGVARRFMRARSRAGSKSRAPAALPHAVRAGFGANSRVHAVSDGAPWIVGQIEQQFGDQGRYLIDFYHVCEYLAAASAAIAPDYVAQQRLKRPSAWWRVEHAEHMLALRINRINGDWDAYWKALTCNAPLPPMTTARTNHSAAPPDCTTLDRNPRAAMSFSSAKCRASLTLPRRALIAHDFTAQRSNETECQRNDLTGELLAEHPERGEFSCAGRGRSPLGQAGAVLQSTTRMI